VGQMVGVAAWQSVTRGFMGPLGGFWPKLGRKRVTGWKQRSCVPPGRVKTNKQTFTYQNIIHIKPLSKYFDITLIGNFFDQTLKFDRFIDILSHQTRVKFLDQI
jgi:hypothetical protein